MGTIFVHESILEEKALAAKALLEKMQSAENFYEKLDILNQDPLVDIFLEKSDSLRVFLSGLTPECDFAIKSILAIGQGPIVFNRIDSEDDKFEKLRMLLQTLLEVEKFYDQIGGIIGYYYTFLSLLLEKNGNKNHKTEVRFVKPPGIDITAKSPSTESYVKWGIDSLETIGEIYPIGGAGDRLNLKDEKNGEALPAAQLMYEGITLLEGLIRDLQAKEYLHWKIYQKCKTTPIAMMTSHEKNNHENILNIFEMKNWFGRPKTSFKFFIQPLVPVITEEGNFSILKPLKMNLKPGGHGAIWKLAKDHGVIDWFEELGRHKVLLRQINNPIAGVDNGILAFTGIGSKKEKAFGFASCPRRLKAAEGMIVLLEKHTTQSYRYSITNIEYTDFNCKGIEDVPEKAGSQHSAFPANTNILFAKINEIKKALEVCSIPGKMINMKTKMLSMNEQGEQVEVFAGRLESMMQNIADYIYDEYPSKLEGQGYSELRTFATYNDRRKTISVTKNEYNPEKTPLETPEGCFYDQQLNNHELFTEFCQFSMPEMESLEKFVEKGPSFIVRYHPALGPTYKIISQKIQQGACKKGAEVILDIAEIHISDLELEGSLHVKAMDAMGSLDDNKELKYSDRNGKCELRNVKVVNLGIDWEAPNRYWKNDISRNEALEIIIHGNGEFFAENVIFNGSQKIKVPAGHRMEAIMKDGKISYKVEKISGPTWKWDYAFDANDAIQLTKRHMLRQE